MKHEIDDIIDNIDVILKKSAAIKKIIKKTTKCFNVLLFIFSSSTSFNHHFSAIIFSIQFSTKQIQSKKLV